MATVYSSSGDAWRRKTDSSAWATARGGAGIAGGAGASNASNYSFAIYGSYEGGRGSNTYYCTRTYLPFNLSLQSGTISTAYLNVYASENTTSGSDGGDFAKVIAVQATALGDSNDDHGNCFSSGTTLGTTLSDVVTISGTRFYEFTFTADGKSAMQSLIGSGTFTICIMNWYFDYSNNAPSLNGDKSIIKVYYSESIYDPYLTINYSAAVTHNATFFGANF